jgi:hypothetical protein
MAAMEPGSVDLIFGSPPYERARVYRENGVDLGIARDTEEWVRWMMEVFKESIRVCRGLVAMVVGHGATHDFRWSGAPALLQADLIRAGVCLRDPKFYYRMGIPGSGGPEDLRKDVETIVCATRGGNLPWSDNTACGHAPKYAPGGAMSHRLSDDSRVNQRGKWVDADGNPTGHKTPNEEGYPANFRKQPSHKILVGRNAPAGTKDGDLNHDGQPYVPPDLVNPGNMVQRTYTAQEVAALLAEHGNVVKCATGGGVMGHKLCHQNEAPFPEKLAEVFILTYCRPGGVVLDPFSGSGTSCAVAVRYGRRAIGIDLRQSQINLARRRLAETQGELFQ